MLQRMFGDYSRYKECYKYKKKYNECLEFQKQMMKEMGHSNGQDRRADVLIEKRCEELYDENYNDLPVFQPKSKSET